MNSPLPRITVLCAICFLNALAFAGPVEQGSAKDVNLPDSNNVTWSSPLFGTGIKTSDQYTEGNIFFTVPLWSTIGRDGTLGGDYLYIEPYSSVGKGTELTESLGLSWRHLFSNESVSALQKQGEARFMEKTGTIREPRR